MNNDLCTGNVWWSAIAAAAGDSTLAGVLAGLLIAAAAALLVGWYEESDPHTIALFGSGVPALAFSTYLFTVIAGMSFPSTKESKDADVKQVCSQMWSQWLLAMGLLFIGSAVLVCGLAWALVSYADKLAVKICGKPNPSIKTIEGRREYFIRLSGWLSGGVATTTIALLVSANVVYVKAVPRESIGSDHAWWYTIFAVFMVGILLISRSIFVATTRTFSAQRANRRSCAKYPDGNVLGAAGRQGISRTSVLRRTTQELTTASWVTVGAFLAMRMTSASSRMDYWTSTWKLALSVVGLYLVVRIAHVTVVQRFRRQSAEGDGASPNAEALVDAKSELAERIRIRYSVGLLSATTRCVVGLAILSAFFDVALSQGSFGLPQIVISLFLGGLFPAVILVGLSSSIPAAEDAGDHTVGVPELIRWHSGRSDVPGKPSFGLARLAVHR
jgi:hypothetical protein